MAPSLKASPEGLKIVDIARKKKGWTKTAVSWCDAATIGQSTLRRFWRRNPINQENFVAICEAVGINWQEIVDERPTPSPERDRTLEGRWKVELTAIVQESDKQLMDELLRLVQQRPGIASLKIESAFGEEWRSPEAVLSPNRSRFQGIPQSADTEEFAKEIDLGGGQKVVVVVKRTPQSEQQEEVVLQVYPAREERYLPPGVEVALIDESDTILTCKTTKSTQDSLQFKLILEPGELLSITFKQGDVTITEEI